METAPASPAGGVQPAAPGELACRSCGTPLTRVFVDLGSSPLANAYLTADDLELAEVFYPLRVYVCELCFLVQLASVATPEELFSDYAYLSSYSDSWLRHAGEYVERVTRRFDLNSASKVVEIASNDGYLLQYFKENGIPILGIEPARNAAQIAEAKGIRTLVEFFGVATANELAAGRRERRSADRQQRPRARPGPERLRRGDTGAPSTDGDLNPGVPASAQADRGDRIRHDLPRTRQLLLARRRRASLQQA